MIDSLDRNAIRFLGLAVAISAVIALPIEQVIRDRAYWPESCASGEMLLNLGSFTPAVLTPFVFFLLPGPGGIFRRGLGPPSLSGPLLLITACLCGAGIPLAWWYGLHQYAGTHGVCPGLFDLSPSSDPYHRDYVKDCTYYFTYLSVFAALWAGIAAGGLRLLSARISPRTGLQAKSAEFQTFCWVCLLGWAVQYRLSEWFGLLWTRQEQEWSFLALLNFAFLTISSLWSLTVARSLWNRKPRTMRHAILRAYWRTFLIYLLTSLLLIWSPLIAAAPFSYPILSLNLFGLAWALFVGTGQWHSLKKEYAAEAATA